MKKISLLVMPLMAVSLLVSCNNGGGDKPEEVKFSLSGNPTLDGKVATVNIDWTPNDIIKFESFTFTTTTSKENTVTFDPTGDPRPMRVTITFTEDITEDISGTLKFSYQDVTAKSKGESSLTFTIPKPEPVGHSVINKLTVKDDIEDYYEVTFDYFADNQYVENESNDDEGVYRKIYHIIEKTGDGGYVDYSIEASPSEANGDYMFYTGEINTYDANGKVVSCIGIDPAENIEYQYPDYDYHQLNWIELKFADFELTKFYYTESVESSYNDNSALLKKVNKELYEDEDNKVLSLVTTSVKENIYNSESFLVKNYTHYTNGSIVGRTDYTYDTNDLLTDSVGHILMPKGEDGEFSTFIQTFDVNESSFEDYAQESGFEDLGPAAPRAYMYKETAVPNTFETECFVDSYVQDKYLLENYEGRDYGSYYKKTYGKNGSYKNEVYAYTLTSPEPAGGQTREELQFLDLTPGDLKETHEVIYDDYQNCIKDVYTTINEGVTVVDEYSYEYTIVEGKITQYDNYPVDDAIASTVVEYTTNDNDYGQTFGWVYNNVTKHTLM
ncbi:MAG: hypothetical protein MJ213_03300 [Bacilli bacterium]|nr:hypothetical protein [Bacilli bacterium]